MTDLNGISPLLLRLAAPLKRWIQRIRDKRATIREGGLDTFSKRRSTREQVITDLAAGRAVGNPLEALLFQEFRPLDPFIREWLDSAEVLSALHVASNQSNSPDAIADARAKLKRSYARFRGTTDLESDRAIEMVLGVIRAKLTEEMDRGDHQQVGELSELMESAVGRALRQGGASDGAARALSTQQLRSQLDVVVRERHYNKERALATMRGLTELVRNGPLQWAEPAVRAEVFAWAARLEAANNQAADEVEALIRAAHDVDAGHDLSIANALLLQRQGRIDDGLRALRVIERADARSVFIGMLYQAHGAAGVAEWYDQQPNPLSSEFLSAAGWFSLAVSLAEAGRWEDAVGVVDSVESLETELADLAYLGGVLHVALLLPAEHRRLVLEMNIFHAFIRPAESAEAAVHRSKAIERLRRAGEQLRAVAPGRAQAADDWLRWLALTDPEPEVREKARQELTQALTNQRVAVSLVPLAKEFGIEIDAPALWVHLQKQGRYGGLTNLELRAELTLAEMLLQPAELAEFLGEGVDRFGVIAPLPFLVFKRLEALARAGQVAAARALLEEQRSQFQASEAARIEAMLDDFEGHDVSEALRRVYENSNDLLDLRNLIGVLVKTGQWSAARPLMEELVRREPIADNVEGLVHCVEREGKTSPADVVALIERHSDLARHSKPLRSRRAWALFRAGRLIEAEAALADSRGLGANESDYQLQIELALQTGRWEQFGSIVDERSQKAKDLPAPTLLQLAALAAETDQTPDRAIELAGLAADSAGDEPSILLGAVDLAYRLGKETSATSEWLRRALEASGEAGPVRAIELQELVEEWAPAQRQRQERMEKLWSTGEIPLQLMAHEAGLSMAELFIQIPRRNGRQKDPRRRLIIPIVSGARVDVQIPEGAIVAWDVGSLYLLAELGLLRPVAEALKKMLLPWETMALLLEDRRRAKFHQPSRVDESRRLRAAVDRGDLKLVETASHAPRWLVSEVGRELAELLRAAQISGGHVVHAIPVERAGSYRAETADLREFGELLRSPRDVVTQLHAEGKLNQSTLDRALPYLGPLESASSSGTPIDWAQPIFIDALSLTKLHRDGVLDVLFLNDADLRVARSTVDEMDALIQRDYEGHDTSNTVNALRLALRDLVQEGLVEFLPASRASKGEAREVAPTLTNLLEGTSAADFVCCDDRFVNQRSTMTDVSGSSTPVLTISDVLGWLRRRGSLTVEEHYDALDLMRSRGFAFLAPSEAEIKWRFGRVAWGESDELNETFGLRNVRQMIARWRQLRLLQMPIDAPFLEHLHRLSIGLIREVWFDEAMPIERAVALSEWICRALFPAAYEWLEPGIMDAGDSLAHHLAALAAPLPDVFGERQQAYAKWVDQRIRQTLLPGKQDVVSTVATRFTELINDWDQRDEE